MTSHYIPFQLGNESFLVEAGLVREILGRQEWTPVPYATAQVQGVFPWNGRAVALIDLQTVLEIETARTATERGQRTLVLQVGTEIVGMSVDEVREVVHLKSDEFRPVHAASGRFTQAEVEWTESVARLLDVPAMVQACFQEG